MAEEQVKAFIDSAIQALQAGHYGKAIEFAEQALALDPSHAEAAGLKGIALSHMGQTAEATQALLHSVELGPNNAKARFNLAVHYYGLGQKPEAAEQVQEALRLDPAHIRARDLARQLAKEGVAVDSEVRAAEGPDEGVASVGEGPAPGPFSSPPTAQAYYRPGYENRSVHSVSFVEGLGKAWDQAGYGIGAVGTVFGVVGWARYLSDLAAHRWDVEATQAAQQASMFGSTGDILLFLLSLFTVFLSIAWLSTDIADRRGNWLWLLPFILCCCCSLYGPIMILYIAKGRD